MLITSVCKDNEKNEDNNIVFPIFLQSVHKFCQVQKNNQTTD